VLPDRPAVRAHHHAAAHRRVVRQLRLQDELVVPLVEVLRLGWERPGRHASSISASRSPPRIVKPTAPPSATGANSTRGSRQPPNHPLTRSPAPRTHRVHSVICSLLSVICYL